MDPDDSDADEFFETLAGRRPGGVGASALSAALLAQVRTQNAAEQASAADWTPHEAAQMYALKKRLVANGTSSALIQKSSPDAGWIARIQDLLFGESRSFTRTFAVASGLVMATVLVMKMAPDVEPDPSTVLRGALTHEVRVPDPQAIVSALEADLRAAGADVLSVQINADEWRVLVREVPPASVAAVNERLRQAGLAVEGAPPYELTVRRQSP